MMNQLAAERLASLLMNAARDLAATVEVVEHYADAATLDRHRTAVVDALFAIDVLMRPIMAAFPDLLRSQMAPP